MLVPPARLYTWYTVCVRTMYEYSSLTHHTGDHIGGKEHTHAKYHDVSWCDTNNQSQVSLALAERSTPTRT